MTDIRTIAVCQHQSKASSQETALAEQLGIETITKEALVRLNPRYYFAYLDNSLSLCETRKNSAKPTSVNFSSMALSFRANDAIRKQNLIRSLGLKKNPNPRVLDAMAGLGKDAFLMASAGCEVLMLERSPIIHALLYDGLKRLQCSEKGNAIGSKLSLLQGEFLEFDQAPGSFDVVYLDPMYPGDDRKSKAKADMSRMHTLLGAQNDEPALLRHALTLAQRRVSIKRPKLAAPFAGKEADVGFKGSSARFDVYLSCG